MEKVVGFVLPPFWKTEKEDIFPSVREKVKFPVQL